MSLELKPDIEDEDESENYSVQTPDVVLESEGPSSFEQFKKDAHPEPNKRLSPLLEADEKQGAWNLGQSLDSKKITSALGYLDLK